MKEKEFLDDESEETVVEKPFNEDEFEEDEEELMEIRKLQCAVKLAKYDTTIQEQEKYFEIMKRNDMPIGNALFLANKAIESIGKKDLEASILRAIKEWEDVSEKYQKIEIEDQDENTGKEIIIKMKELITKLLEQLQVWQQNPKEVPEEIRNIVEEMNILSADFVKLPAYIAYRGYGMYKIGSDRLKSSDSK